MTKQPRFIVREMAGFDFGAASRCLSILSEFDSLDDARSLRDAYRQSGDGAHYHYADILDRQDEHVVVQRGFYGNGAPILSIIPRLSVRAEDQVVFDGSRDACGVYVNAIHTPAKRGCSCEVAQ